MGDLSRGRPFFKVVEYGEKKESFLVDRPISYSPTFLLPVIFQSISNSTFYDETDF